MALLTGLTTHKVLEVNFSTALRTGQMIAQLPVAKSDFGSTGIADYIDNGFVFKLTDDGKIALAQGVDTCPLYIHYTEELMDAYVSALKYFTVDYGTDGKAYPRLLALYPGDVFTTNNYVIDEADTTLDQVKYAYVKDGVFQLRKTAITDVEATAGDQAAGHIFAAKASTLPGRVTAVEVMFVR